MDQNPSRRCLKNDLAMEVLKGVPIDQLAVVRGQYVGVSLLNQKMSFQTLGRAVVMVNWGSLLPAYASLGDEAVAVVLRIPS